MNDIENVEGTLPTDDMPTADQEQALLDAVLANSDIMNFTDGDDVPLPDEVEEDVPDPDSDDEVEEDPESEEADGEEDEEEVEETEDEDGAEEDEAPTQEADVFSADDLDLDARVQVKIDGEEMEVSFGDLLKGYQTDSHLSKKGRELGEAQKAFEEERTKQIEEVQQMGEASAQILFGAEQVKQKEYHELEAKIEKAREDGDTYEMNELKDKREQVHKEYWSARRRREDLVEQLQKQKQEQEQAQWQKQIDYFQEKIPELIPNFNEERAGKIREFAIEYGFQPEMLDTITDPLIVKFIDEFRELKSGVTKGAAKRKAVPTKKAIPTKKAKPAKKKAEDAEKMRKARAFREDATSEDHDAFLRDYASRTLKNI